MNDQTMMLILVMAFFMLGCRFSCSGMKEGFCPTFCNAKAGESCNKRPCTQPCKDNNCDNCKPKCAATSQ